jgi:hypothetical protein
MFGPMPEPLAPPRHGFFDRFLGKRSAAAADSGVGDNPGLADHERPRVLKQKTTETTRRRGAAKDRSTKEPNVSADQRVREFPDQSLKEQLSKLYCACCKMPTRSSRFSSSSSVTSTCTSRR